MILEVFVTLGILLFLISLGYQVALLILSDDDRFLLMSLAFPVGGGLLTWCIFILSWMGIDNIRIVIISLCALLFIGIWFLRKRIKLNPSNSNNRNLLNKSNLRGMASWSSVGLTLLLGILVVLAFGLSVLKSYSVWDGVAYWSIKGYGIAYENSFYASQNWGPHGFDYPMNIQILISIFKVIAGDLLPGSKTIFPMFYTSLLLGALAFWRRFGMDRSKALIGLILLGTIPIVFQHATVGYANLALAYYLIFAVIWGAIGILNDERNLQLICGILLGFASWTRPEGILYSIVIIIALLSLKWFYRESNYNLLVLGLPILIIAGTWYIFYSSHGGGDSQAMGSLSMALQIILQGKFNISEFFSIGKQFLKSMLDFRVWGLLFPFSIILVLLHFKSVHKSLRPIIATGLIGSVLFGMITAFLFYIGSFHFDLDFLLGWMARSFNRTILPASIMLCVTSLSLLGNLLRFEQGKSVE